MFIYVYIYLYIFLYEKLFTGYYRTVTRKCCLPLRRRSIELHRGNRRLSGMINYSYIDYTSIAFIIEHNSLISQVRK